MNKYFQSWMALAGILGFSVLPVHVDASPPEYSVTVLGSLGGSKSVAYGLNDAGQVAGGSYLSGSQHAVVWTGTTPTDSGAGGGAASINASGQAAGYAILPGFSDPHAIRITGMTVTDLGTVDGGAYSYGNGINASGQVAGSATLPVTFDAVPVLWTGTTAQVLTTLGGANSAAYAVNDSAEVTGYSELSGASSYHAVLWTRTTVQDLGTLGGPDSQGIGINNAGQVAGYAQTASGAAHAAIWNGTTPTDLGTLGGTNSYGYAINANGDVVGMSYLPNNTTQDPFLYMDGTMYNLDSLLVPGSGVTGVTLGDSDISFGGNSINDSDQIAAYGTLNGVQVALLLTPTPEPGSVMLALFGGFGLLTRRRRSARS